MIFTRVDIIIYFLFLNCLTIFSQGEGDSYEFIGTIQLQDKSIISYKIQFTEYENGEISGTSVTDFSGEHRTESTIRGRIKRDNNTISFSEEGNLNTKSNAQPQDFCYIHLYNAKIKLRKKKSIIQGHFFSRYKNGELCVEGDIYLIGKEQFYQKFERLSKRTKPFISKEKYQSSIDKFNNTKLSMENNILENNENITFYTSEPVLEMNVLDDQVIDGDRISLFINDSIVINDAKITSVGIHKKINIKSDTTTVRIVAKNEGKLPPNTAKIIFPQIDNTDNLKYKLNKGEHVEIRFVKGQYN